MKRNAPTPNIVDQNIEDKYVNTPKDQSFRMRRKGHYFTWPQNEKPLNEIMENLKTFYSGYDPILIVVCSEYHAHKGEEEPHLHRHALVHLNREFNKRVTLNELDKIADKHGYYTGYTKGYKAALLYTLKDEDYISWTPPRS